MFSPILNVVVMIVAILLVGVLIGYAVGRQDQRTLRDLDKRIIQTQAETVRQQREAIAAYKQFISGLDSIIEIRNTTIGVQQNTIERLSEKGQEHEGS